MPIFRTEQIAIERVSSLHHLFRDGATHQRIRFRQHFRERDQPANCIQSVAASCLLYSAYDASEARRAVCLLVTLQWLYLAPSG